MNHHQKSLDKFNLQATETRLKLHVLHLTWQRCWDIVYEKRCTTFLGSWVLGIREWIWPKDAAIDGEKHVWGGWKKCLTAQKAPFIIRNWKVEVRRVCRSPEVAAAPLTAATSSEKPTDHTLRHFISQLKPNHPAEHPLNEEFKFWTVDVHKFGVFWQKAKPHGNTQITPRLLSGDKSRLE